MRRFPRREQPPERRLRRDLPRPEGPFDRLLRRRPDRDPAPLIIGGTIGFLALLILLVFLFSSVLGGGGGDGGDISGLPPGIRGSLADIPGLPPGLVAVSDYVEFETDGEVPATIGLPLQQKFDDAARLGFYTFLDRRWQKITDVRLAQGGRLGESDFAPVPQNLAVLQLVAQAYQVAGSLPAGGQLHTDADINIASPRDYTPVADGSVQGQASELDLAEDTLLMPTIVGSGDNSSVVNDILSDENLRKQHAEAIARLASDAGLDGVDLEYSLVDPALGSAFSEFVKDLTNRLHEGGKRLSLTLPPPTGQRQAYDWQALGRMADIVKVLPIADAVQYWEQMPEAIDQIVQDVDPRKVMLVISPFSIERAGEISRPIGYNEAMGLATQTAVREPAEADQIKPGIAVKLAAVNLDPGEGASTLTWSNQAAILTFAFGGVQTRTIFVENVFSAGFKLELAQAYGLGGVAVSDASGGSDAANIWPAVNQLTSAGTVSLARPNDGILQPRWEAPDGGDIGGGTGTTATWIAPTEAKSYTILFIVSDGDKRFGRKTTIEVKPSALPTLTPVVTFPAESPTPTPTPTPTVTTGPSPTPTPTPTGATLTVQVGKRADGDDANTGFPKVDFEDPEETSPLSDIEYRVIIDNDSDVAVTIESVVDDKLGAVCANAIGDTLQPDDGDADVTTEDGPDATVCTFTTKAPGPPFNNPLVNTVTVTVKDAGGATATDADDCTVNKS